MSAASVNSSVGQNEVQHVEVLSGNDDKFGGVLVEIKDPMDSTVFASILRASIQQWKKQGKKGVWMKVPIQLANLVEAAVKQGFWFLHAEPSYLILVSFIGEGANTLPVNATHRVGVGAFVMNEKREGEDIFAAVVREVKEKTGFDTEFDEVPAFRSLSLQLSLSMAVKPDNGWRKRSFDCTRGVAGSDDTCLQKKCVMSEDGSQNNGAGLKNVGVQKKDQNKICEFWVSGNCVKDTKCQFLHSWSRGDGFSMLAKLGGHEKAVTGIALPSGSDKLYSGSIDGTVRVWDCHTGQCACVINYGDKIGSLISVGLWVFVGMPNVVKAFNIQTSAELSLKGPVGQVNAMVIANDMVFAGLRDGVISAWKGGSETNPLQLVATMEGHTCAVTCLTVGSKMLFSGSMDHTIRVWDLDSLQLIMTLNGHTDSVMSLLCWDQYLLSCSLDQTIKVWVANEEGNWEVTFTHKEEHGLLALSGLNDTEAKPILLCSCNDNSVHLYELPSFTERGRLFSKEEVRNIHVGPDGLFFTGDGIGMLTVWKWLAKPIVGAS